MTATSTPHNNPDPPVGDAAQPGHELRDADQVIAAEHCWLRERRRTLARGDGDPAGDLVGVAFSGGGIRSASFALGILQSLAKRRLLRRVDYLSTVSGGGYIGSWLSAWIHRDGLDHVEGELGRVTASSIAAPAGAEPPVADSPVADRSNGAEPSPTAAEVAAIPPEPPQVEHLRNYSNYLTPRLGLFSQDTWTGLAGVVRGFLLNQLVLLPLVVLMILAIRVVVYYFEVPSYGQAHQLLAGTVAAFLASLGIAFFWTADKVLQTETAGGGKKGRVASMFARLAKLPPFRWCTGALPHHTPVLVGLLFFACICSCWLTSRDSEGRVIVAHLVNSVIGAVDLVVPVLDEEFADARALLSHEALTTAWDHDVCLLCVILFASFHLVIDVLVLCLASVSERGLSGLLPRHPWQSLYKLWCVALSGAAGGFLFYLLLFLFIWPCYEHPYAIATFGPPLAIVVYTISALIQVGLLSRTLSEAAREWWASVCGWMLSLAAAWSTILAIVVFLPPAIQLLGREASDWASAGVAAGWMGAVIAGVASIFTAKGADSGWVRRWVIRLTPILFILGLLGGIAHGLHHLIYPGGLIEEVEALVTIASSPAALAASGLASSPSTYLAGLRLLPETVWWIALGTAALAVIAAFTIDVNIFSLHSIYTNRLVRCYLGASRPLQGAGRRTPDLLTGFDPDDDLPLSLLATHDSGAPLHLLNTTLNLAATDKLSWQERKAAPFLLSPLFCGSVETGYRPTAQFGGTTARRGMTLGHALGISGAAASPSMGSSTEPVLAVLMTVFNVRLGWWAGNPRDPHGAWRLPGPRVGLKYLCYEMFSLTNERRPFIYLSDGAHFENLAVYELLRRRCRIILVSDAGADLRFEFADLGNLIRKARIDLGVEIVIHEQPLRPAAGSRESSAHFVQGIITYPPRFAGDERQSGVLLYLKPTLTGKEPADVRNYARLDPAFPHQSTANQFFSESQLESYRALGFYIAEAAMAHLDSAESPMATSAGDGSVHSATTPSKPAAAR